jgi:hypothetical protein
MQGRDAMAKTILNRASFIHHQQGGNRRDA